MSPKYIRIYALYNSAHDGQANKHYWHPATRINNESKWLMVPMKDLPGAYQYKKFHEITMWEIKELEKMYEESKCS